MGAEKKMPEVRFKEFSDSWKSSSLNKNIEVLDGDRGHNYPSTGDLKEQGHTLFLSASNVTKRGFEFNSKQYITLEKSQSMGNGKLALNDIVLTSRGSIGHIAWYDEIVKQKVPYARINSGMLILRSNDSMCPSIVSQYLKSPIGAKKIDLISFGSAQPQLTKASVSKLKITIPENKTEQSLVGSYFQKLDTLINQHQQKHDKFSNLKKAMLEKMFPKAGETVPEIRFDGFTGNWTTTSLSKIAHVIDPHPSHRAPDAVANGVPFIGIGDVAENGHVDFKNVRIVPYHIYGEHRQRYQVEVGDFAYGRVASIGKIIDLSSNVDREYTYSPTMAIVKPVTLYSPYLKGYMNTSVFKGRVDNKTTGSTRKSLGVQDFRELPVCFPEQQEEQIKIGDYFQKLGLLINQHKHQITKLKNIKQACLDKMFV